MLRLTVLSPHRDDAAFSLFCALTKWQRRPVEIRVINFFTESAYAPHAEQAAGMVSAIRKREDRAVLQRIGRRIRVMDLGLLDAPLRLGISALAVCNAETACLLREELVFELARRIRCLQPSLILAPLGLGGHIDHLTVHRAALRAGCKSRLGFYEDLPYRTWTLPEDLRCRIRSAEREMGTLLKAVTAGDARDAWQKRRHIRRYQSQITAEEAAAMARWTREERGEKLWLPRQSKYWPQLLLDAPQHFRERPLLVDPEIDGFKAGSMGEVE